MASISIFSAPTVFLAVFAQLVAAHASGKLVDGPELPIAEIQEVAPAAPSWHWAGDEAPKQLSWYVDAAAKAAAKLGPGAARAAAAAIVHQANARKGHSPGCKRRQERPVPPMLWQLPSSALEQKVSGSLQEEEVAPQSVALATAHTPRQLKPQQELGENQSDLQPKSREEILFISVMEEVLRGQNAYTALFILIPSVCLVLLAAAFVLYHRDSPQFGPQQSLPYERHLDPVSPHPAKARSLGHSEDRQDRQASPASHSSLPPASAPNLALAEREPSGGGARSPAPVVGAILDQPQSSKKNYLCPTLVVPSGMEFVFAVREVVTRERQQISFSIIDMKGQPLSHVIVNETTGSKSGIYLQMLDMTPLAYVRTDMVHERPGSLPEICKPSEKAYCVMVRGTQPECQYILRHMSGQQLLTFQGDFKEKAINVLNPSGRLVCATERRRLDFDSAPHYQVRVAPHADAGLLLCGLLAIDKLEGSST
mmetsp:Transcript_53610/g.115818  ORF Transcript_53610/g.115818 Transcript_53610/m.115818 type:complete len:482 (-) Transcript_53610:119-1564(-)